MATKYYIDESRIDELADTLSKTKRIIPVIEDNDPQYRAVYMLAEKKGCGVVALSIVANALVSYQLTSRGETYWSMFAEWMMKTESSTPYYLLETHTRFLRDTPYNRLGLSRKIERLKKIYNSTLASELYDNPLKYCERIDELTNRISNILGTDPFAKTIVFAGKMYYYVCRACGASVGGEIPVPVDRRVAYVSLSSCLIKGCSSELIECSRDLMKPRYRNLVINAWIEVSKKSGIPSYNLDSIIWVLGRYIRSSRGVKGVLQHILAAYPGLSRHIDDLRRIVMEFMKCR